MKESIKIARALEKARKIAEAAGLEFNIDINLEEEKVREAESTLAYKRSDGVGFWEKKCVQCKDVFATNYDFVAYCSNPCRIKALDAIGISWSPDKKPEERWNGVPPLVIPPVALELVKARM